MNKSKILVEMVGAYGKELSKGSLRLMLRALEDVPTGKLDAAAVDLLRSSRWMPTVADLREAAGVPGEEIVEWNESTPVMNLSADVRDWLIEYDHEFDTRSRGKATDAQVERALASLGREGQEVDRDLI